MNKPQEHYEASDMVAEHLNCKVRIDQLSAKDRLTHLALSRQVLEELSEIIEGMAHACVSGKNAARYHALLNELCPFPAPLRVTLERVTELCAEVDKRMQSINESLPEVVEVNEMLRVAVKADDGDSE